MIQQAINSKANIKKTTASDIPYALQVPVIATYKAVSTAGQTTISNLGFSVDTTANDQVAVYYNGQRLTEGSTNDYTFASVDSYGFSSAIQFNFALAVNKNILVEKYGLKIEKEFQVDSRFNGIYETFGQLNQSFLNISDYILTATTLTPAAGQFYSSITNRAAILDPNNDLKSRIGVERIITQGIIPLFDEYGPNGEAVYALTGDSYGYCRFVGNISTPVMSTGSYVSIANSSSPSYFEIVFLGTGLNLLLNIGNFSRDIRYAVDNGSFTTILNSSMSGVLESRNYTSNQILSVTQNLSYGVHTIRIQNFDSTNVIHLMGVEVVNNLSNLVTSPGSSFINGKKVSTSGQSSLQYNSSITGTKGGRVVTYQKSDSTIEQVTTSVNTQTLFMSSADHSNEEIAQTYFVRDFGAGRTDDFSTLNTTLSDRGYVLDDNMTSLIAKNVAAIQGANSIDGIYTGASGYLMFTFVGSGIDMQVATQILGSDIDDFTVYVDNVSVGTIGTLSYYSQTLKIASGLPYGSHVLKIVDANNGVTNNIIQKFIVYQPKKPILPLGVFEISDYNVLANFSSSGNSNIPSTGVIRKMCSREFLYSGTWNTPLIDILSSGAVTTGTAVAGSYYEYVFFGSGVEVSHYHNTGVASTSLTISIDGSTNLSGFTTTSFGSSISSFSPATGGITLNSTYGINVFQIRGLTLGAHKVRMTWNSGGTSYASAIDVITTIHSYKTNAAYSMQGEVLAGALGAIDSRRDTTLKSIKKKNISKAYGITVNPSTSVASTAIPCPEMNVRHYCASGQVRINFSINLSHNSVGFSPTIYVYVDGVPYFSRITTCVTSGSAFLVTIDEVLYVSPGWHRFDGFWNCSASGTTTGYGTSRTLIVHDI